MDSFILLYTNAKNACRIQNIPEQGPGAGFWAPNWRTSSEQMNGTPVTPRPPLPLIVSFHHCIAHHYLEVVKILAPAARMQAAAALTIFAWHVPIISKCRQMLYCLQD